MELIAKTMHGFEHLLLDELKAIGAKDCKELVRAVAFTGDLEVLYKANLYCRTAIRILKKSYAFTANDENELYDEIKKIEWENHMTLDETLAVDSSVNSERFKHSKYASLKVKDAIVDRFRQAYGRRPNVDPEDPNLRLNLFIYDNQVTINIDSSGTSLHKRGYRTSGHLSPLNEVLAAGMVMLSGWTKDQPLYDPMCGSGTVPIEAALLASNTAPGLLRNDFGFMKWKDYDEKLWNDIIDEAKKKIDLTGIQIKASDISGIHVRMARTAAEAVGMDACIDFFKGDFFEQEAEEGYVIMNPPYGERMDHHDIETFYEETADHLKANFAGTECWFISSNNEALLRFGLRPSKKIVLYNGSLECLFQKFELYKGSKKAKYQEGGIDHTIHSLGSDHYENRERARKSSDREPSHREEAGQRLFSRSRDNERGSERNERSNRSFNRDENRGRGSDRSFDREKKFSDHPNRDARNNDLDPDLPPRPKDDSWRDRHPSRSKDKKDDRNSRSKGKFGRDNRDNDRPKRSYDKDRKEGPSRSFNKDRNDDRPKRDFDRNKSDDRPKRTTERRESSGKGLNLKGKRTFKDKPKGDE